MQLYSAIILPSLVSLASAGVAVVGFNDNGSLGCQQGLGSVTINGNGNCVNFPAPFNGIQVAGGGSNECFLEIFFGRDCTIQSTTNIGPINDPNLGGCIGPFPVGGGTFAGGLMSGRTVNCPT